MDKKVQKQILQYLRLNAKRTKWSDIQIHLKNNNIILEDLKLDHQLNVLVSDDLLFQEEAESTYCYSLTAKGYREFDPLYKKFWRFFTDDFAKLLSVISIVISIIVAIKSL